MSESCLIQVLSDEEIVDIASEYKSHVSSGEDSKPVIHYYHAESYARAIEAAILAKLADRLKDAERYAWLREQDDPEGKFSVVEDIFWRGAGDCDPSFFGSGKDLDVAIDAQVSLTLKGSQSCN